jgi:hypothetical protein
MSKHLDWEFSLHVALLVKYRKNLHAAKDSHRSQVSRGSRAAVGDDVALPVEPVDGFFSCRPHLFK